MRITALQTGFLQSRGLTFAAASLKSPEQILAQISRCQKVLYQPAFDAAAFRTELAPLLTVSIDAISNPAKQADFIASNFETRRQPRIEIGKLLTEMRDELPGVKEPRVSESHRHRLEHLAGPPPKLATADAAQYFARIPWENLREQLHPIEKTTTTSGSKKGKRTPKRGGRKRSRRSAKSKQKSNLHRIANTSEAPILKQLREVANRYGAEVFLKMRVGAVLKIKKGAIDTDLFEFAKKGEFDFVVATGKGNNKYPLFGLEFDGPHHDMKYQKRNDAKKNALCEEYNFPLLRIAYDDQRKYGEVDIVTCLAELGLMAEAFHAKQEKGQIPKDVPFTLVNLLAWSSPKQRVPVWLGFVIRMKIQRLFEEGQCGDAIPSCLVGVDDEGNYHALASIRLADRRRVIFGETYLRKQLYPYIPVDLLEELAIHELYKKLTETIEKDEEGETRPTLNSKLDEFRENYEVLREVEV